MVFTIIAGIMSLLLLLLLIYGSSAISEFAYIIITLEVGLLVVIIQAIVRIYMYEARLKNEQDNGMDSVLQVRSCPDYWTLHEDGTARTCNNSYTSPDGGTVFRMQSATNTVNIAALDGKTIKTVCDAAKVTQTPWTDVLTACESYNIYGQ